MSTVSLNPDILNSGIGIKEGLGSCLSWIMSELVAEEMDSGKTGLT